MRKLTLHAAVLFLALWTLDAFGQADPTAIRRGRIQAGATYSNANSDATGNRIGGVSFYGTYDFYKNFGLEANIHLLQFHTSQDYGERSYLVGLRYMRPYRRFQPYIKGMGGLGKGVDQQAYVTTNAEHWAVFGFGVGLDYPIAHNITLRPIEFQQQFWPHFPPHGLTPRILSIGAAYRF